MTAGIEGTIMNSQNTDQRQSFFVHDEQFENSRRRRLTRGFLLAAWLIVLFLPGSSFAQSVLVDDAHTSTAPKLMDSNFGTNPNLFVNTAGNIYIKFKVSSTLPAGTPGSAVERATLKLYLANVTTPGKLDCLHASWSMG